MAPGRWNLLQLSGSQSSPGGATEGTSQAGVSQGTGAVPLEQELAEGCLALQVPLRLQRAARGHSQER